MAKALRGKVEFKVNWMSKYASGGKLCVHVCVCGYREGGGIGGGAMCCGGRGRSMVRCNGGRGGGGQWRGVQSGRAQPHTPE